jgi:hypothetical protein
MPLDPHECHVCAQRCLDLAAETTDIDAQEILVSTAQLGASRLQARRRSRRPAGAAPPVNIAVAGMLRVMDPARTIEEFAAEGYRLVLLHAIVA